jgi:hypothetical protein
MSSRTKGKEAARERAAQMRAAQARAERRRRLVVAAAAIAAVAVIVGALVVAKLSGAGDDSTQATGSTGAAAAVVRDATSVSATTLDKIGAGGEQAVPKAIDATDLKADGKPRVVYVGAEYCPFCAAERWPVVVALSRFGTWSGLGATASGTQDVFPGTETLSFHGASYTSDHVSFTGVETRGNQISNGQYEPLDSLSAADQKLFETYDRPPYTSSEAGSIPFIDIAGRYVSSGATYSPEILKGMSRAQIAAALSDPTDPVAKAVGSSANVLTAAICEATGGQPTNVCRSEGVKAGAAALAKGQQK